MKKYTIGLITGALLAVSVMMFMGAQNKNLVTAVTLRDGGTVEIISNHKISGNKIERVGKYYEWYHGRIKEEGNYKNDLKDGKWTSWEDNRDGDWIKQSEGTYKNGEENGKWTAWHSNGKKLKEGNFKNGKPHGKITKWYSSGKKRYEETYKDGKRISRKSWDRDGNEN
jgi:antitoxin component YwqK of YwqJK toxin-antitoxin module